jgi:Fe-S-cluster containining protein
LKFSPVAPGLREISGASRHFACTQCGKCCNRSPEMELSEAAGLADVFVFRLMFRLYRLARVPAAASSREARAFYEKKRLLRAHAGYIYPGNHAGKAGDTLNYLMISALALQTRRGACVALSESRCSIYDRRPLTCRAVPFHYSRTEVGAERDFDAFVRAEGYRCDVSARAPVVLKSGSIIDSETREVRSRALVLAKHDLPWKEAIVRAMKTSGDPSLPTLRQVEDHADFGAMTTSMRIGWTIAARAGIVTEQELSAIVRTQLVTIDRELENGIAAPEDVQTLQEMRAEYAAALMS